MLCYLERRGRHGELKYLSSHGKEIKRDSLSSDERRGKSSNHKNIIGSSLFYGVVGLIYGEATKPDILYKLKENKVGTLTKEGKSPVSE